MLILFTLLIYSLPTECELALDIARTSILNNNTFTPTSPAWADADPHACCAPNHPQFKCDAFNSIVEMNWSGFFTTCQTRICTVGLVQFDLRFPNLKKLDLSNNNMRGSLAMAVNSNIEVLVLNNNAFGNMPISGFTNSVEEIYLSRNRLNTNMSNVTAPFPTSISKIDLSFNSLSGTLTMGYATLTTLDIRNNRFSGLVAVTSPVALTSCLTDYNNFQNGVSGYNSCSVDPSKQNIQNGCVKLKTIVDIPSITNFCCLDNPNIVSCDQNDQITAIKLSNQGITDLTTANWLQFDNLQILDLSRNEIGYPGVSFPSTLKFLNISSTRITNLEVIKTLSIDKLDISNIKFNTQDPPPFPNNIIHLYINNCAFRGQLTIHNTLVVLSASMNMFTSVAMSRVGQSTPTFTNLLKLDLSHNLLTEIDPLFVKVPTLLLSNNQIVTIQFDAASNVKYEMLDLSNNLISSSVNAPLFAPTAVCDVSNNDLVFGGVEDPIKVGRCNILKNRCDSQPVIDWAYYRAEVKNNVISGDISLVLEGSRLTAARDARCPSNDYYVQHMLDTGIFDAIPAVSALYSERSPTKIVWRVTKRKSIKIGNGNLNILEPLLFYSTSYKSLINVPLDMFNTGKYSLNTTTNVDQLGILTSDQNILTIRPIQRSMNQTFFYNAVIFNGVESKTIEGVIRVNLFDAPIFKEQSIEVTVKDNLLRLPLSDLIVVDNIFVNSYPTPNFVFSKVKLNETFQLTGKTYYSGPEYSRFTPPIAGYYDNELHFRDDAFISFDATSPTPLNQGIFPPLINIVFSNENNVNYTFVNLKIFIACPGATQIMNAVNYRDAIGNYPLCIECPIGADCETNGDIPKAAEGFYFDETDYTYVRCSPAEACLGANICTDGYDGNRCGKCASSPRKYYKNNMSCLACPDNYGPVEIALFVFAAIFAVCALLYIKLKFKNLIVFSILFQYFQILYIIQNLILDWSDGVQEFFTIISVFSFNVDLAKPECLNPDLTYIDKAKFVMMIPILFFVGSWVFTMVSLVKRSFRDAVLTNLAMNHLFLQIIYVTLCSWILGFFSCQKSGNQYVMTKMTYLSCSDPLYKENIGIFAFGVVVYVIGIPLYFSTLFKGRMQIKFLKLKSLTTFMLTNKQSDYRESGEYIIAIHLGLKCLIICCQALLNDITVLQALFIMMLTVTYLGFLIHSKPYKKIAHTKIDIACQISSIVTLCCGILFYVVPLANVENAQEYSMPLTVTVIGVTCALIVLVFYQLNRDLRAKQVTDVEEIKRLESLKRKTVATKEERYSEIDRHYPTDKRNIDEARRTRYDETEDRKVKSSAILENELPTRETLEDVEEQVEIVEPLAEIEPKSMRVVKQVRSRTPSIEGHPKEDLDGTPVFDTEKRKSKKGVKSVPKSQDL